MRVEEAGSGGRRVLFLHDELGPAPSAAFVEGLARRTRVVAPHLTGFGRSEGEPDVTGVDDLAYLCMDLLDSLPQDEPVTVVGSSLGGWVGLQLATTYAHRIERLLLIGPLGLKLSAPDQLDFLDLYVHPEQIVAERSFADPTRSPLLTPAVTDEEILERARHREALVQHGWRPYLHDPKLRNRVRRASMPCVVVTGDQDRFVRDGYYDDFVGELPNAKLVEVSGCGHYPAVERPAETADMVADLIA